jgi:hypothetical protein
MSAVDLKSKAIRGMGYRVQLQECETPHLLTHLAVEAKNHRVNIHVWADGAIAVSVQTFAKPRRGKTVASCAGILGDSIQLSEALRRTKLCCFGLGESLAEERRTPLVDAWDGVVKKAGWAFF